VNEKKIRVNKTSGPVFKDFFKTTKGLHVLGSFKNFILKAAHDGMMIVPEGFEFSYIDLSSCLHDGVNVRVELNEGEVFENVNIFLAFLAGLISREKDVQKGEDGMLLMDGKGNIFCVRGVNGEKFDVILYYCNSSNRHEGWHLHALHSSVNCRWGIHNRVFRSS